MPYRNHSLLRISSAQILRVLLLLTILLLIRWQHLKRIALRDSTELHISLAAVQELFPAATQLLPNLDPNIPFDALDADANRLGFVMQTSPEADHIIGFSGPTNSLIGFDATTQQTVGVIILSSDDTRDHVRLVRSDEEFLGTFVGLTKDQLASTSDIDAVSGATLTCLAIQESIALRMGGKQTSVKFPNPLSVEQISAAFPDAMTINEDPQIPGHWNIFNDSGQLIGSILRTSPYADNTVGYQGPTDALLHLDQEGKVINVQVAESFDNEPYTDYVREDDYFRSLFDGYTLDELAVLDPIEAQIEGVSGATMTSMAVTDGIVLAAQESRKLRERLAKLPDESSKRIDLSALGTGAVILFSFVIGFTRLRGRKYVRLSFQVLLVVYLGLINGDLISQAMLVGWAEHGVPTKHATGLLLLTAAAFLLPISLGNNHYCAHLCPHGALQQLARNRRLKIQMPKKVVPFLRAIPVFLLGWCIIVPLLALPFSLVDIEPFDAWIWHAAGSATIAVAVVGLVSSLFYPMAYCRFGCPTGLVLGYLRSHSGSGRWTRADTIAVAFCGLAIGIWSVF